MIHRLIFWRFFLRLVHHMAPGYIKTAPHRVLGRKVTIKACVEIPLWHGGSQKLHGTFGEILAETRALHDRPARLD